MAPPPGFDPVTDSQYHYVPTEWVCIVFVVLFGLTTLTHLGQALYFRMWWLLPTVVLAGIGEILGWSGRLWSSQNYGILDTPFLMQISATILAPTPLLAAYFILLGRLIGIMGAQYSRIGPRMYTAIFLTADIVALVVQAAGGGIASGSEPIVGGNIMLGGIIFQFVAMVIFVCLATEFIVRYALRRPVRKIASQTGDDTPATIGSSSSMNLEKIALQPRLSRKIRLLLGGMAFSILCLFIRAVYRTIELSDGWSGRIISTQVYFNVLDGMMVFLAILSLNIFHPGWLLETKSA